MKSDIAKLNISSLVRSLSRENRLLTTCDTLSVHPLDAPTIDAPLFQLLDATPVASAATARFSNTSRATLGGVLEIGESVKKFFRHESTEYEGIELRCHDV